MPTGCTTNLQGWRCNAVAVYQASADILRPYIISASFRFSIIFLFPLFFSCWHFCLFFSALGGFFVKLDLIRELAFYYTPSYKFMGGWIHSVHLCSSVDVSDCVCTISPELLNHVLPNLVLWCIIMRWCVMQKSWFTIFNVKVTTRDYVIKIFQFLLYLLNCWFVCTKMWFDSTAS